jgi:nifR3 family TIM-barrel protein
MKEPINFGFWKMVVENAVSEQRPILTLAPMADVTDEAFRRIIAKYSRMGQKGGGPDALWTEFVSADGLCSSGRRVLLRDLAFSENERPIVAQLFTSHPEKMKQATELVAKLGFDGLDINMGCPDRSIEKQHAGAAMMKNVENAIAVIKAAREGAGKLPVSVKTRIGYNKIEIDTWIRALLEQKLPVLTIHLRTRKEMSDVPAHWELMPEIIKLRNEISPETLIIGNGDVESLADAKEKSKKYGCDGIMFGRAVFGNPWLFDENKSKEQRVKSKDEEKKVIGEKLRVMVEHTELFIKLLGDVKSFATMKKHYKAYVNGWDGAKELRMKLMEAKDAKEAKEIVDEYLKHN